MQDFVTRQHMTNDCFEAYHYRDAHLDEVELHHHDFFEIFLFIGGYVRYLVESRAYSLLPGDVLLISPQELHQPTIQPGAQPYERMVIWVDRAFLRRLGGGEPLLEACFNLGAGEKSNLLRLPPAQSELLFQAARTLIREQKEALPWSAVLAQARLIELLAELNRLFTLHGCGAETPGTSNPTLEALVAYINGHLERELSLDALAKTFYISKYHLSRLFRRQMGTSPHRYIVQRRLIRAKELLLDGRQPHRVYQSCGFSDYSAFYRAFVAEYGLSPRRYLDAGRSCTSAPP